MQERDAEQVAFPELSDAQMAVLAEIGTRRRLEDGEPLFRAGERGGGFYVVVSGAVEIVDRSGDEPRTVPSTGPASSPVTSTS